MDIKTRETLIKRYKKIPNKTPAKCLKYHYKYSDVNVNLYFDAFDKKSLSFCMVLVAEKKFYFTSLNILDKDMNTEYLPKIPNEILKRILVNNKLDDFYLNMEKHILQDNPHINYYSKDKIFTNTVAFNKGSIDLPFWQGIRRVGMSNDTLKKLSHRADISIDMLREIQSNNLTLVRTADPLKRRNLTLLLGKHNIKL